MENTLTPIQANYFLWGKKLLALLRISLAVEPILVNLMAILLAIGLLVLLHYPILFPNLGHYHPYFTSIIYGLILLQTLKSATKSLLIPVIAIGIAGLGMLLLSFSPDASMLSLDTLKKMMLLGVIGVGMSVFVMH